jgi:hypothetical protein
LEIWSLPLVPLASKCVGTHHFAITQSAIARPFSKKKFFSNEGDDSPTTTATATARDDGDAHRDAGTRAGTRRRDDRRTRASTTDARDDDGRAAAREGRRVETISI